MKAIFAAAFILLFLCNQAVAMESSDDKIKLATVYFDLCDFKSIIDAQCRAILSKDKNISKHETDNFANEFISALYPEFRNIMIGIVAKSFTIEELSALINFYSSPIGLKISKKSGMLFIQADDSLTNLFQNLEKKFSKK